MTDENAIAQTLKLSAPTAKQEQADAPEEICISLLERQGMMQVSRPFVEGQGCPNATTTRPPLSLAQRRLGRSLWVFTKLPKHLDPPRNQNRPSPRKKPSPPPPRLVRTLQGAPHSAHGCHGALRLSAAVAENQ